MKLKLVLAALALSLTFGSAAAHADSITFTLVNGSQNISGQNGGDLTYTVTAAAAGTNGADVFLNGETGNVDSPLALDYDAFFTNFPFWLSPTISFTGDAFTVHIAPGTLAGVYHGTITFLGGGDGGSADVLQTLNFTTTVTPEPSSFLLLGTGAAGVFAAIRRKRFNA